MDETARAQANLVAHTTTPLNAEPSMARLVASFAWDNALQTQPGEPDTTWNLAGYLATHQYRIHVSVG